MFYLVRTPVAITRLLYPKRLWSMPATEKKIYLTFDDGPHPDATPWVLDKLREYAAHATFFCIGKNVAQYPGIYKRILAEGHATGNHTYHHFDGRKTADRTYFDDIIKAAGFIDSRLFRPPYGSMTSFQAKNLSGQPGYTIVMWSVLSGDFDAAVTPETCFLNVQQATGNGSIVVFHDSEKASEKMKYALENTLRYFSERGFQFTSLPAMATPAK
jgi:peptidoglycan/xylan/chitin deacetylase (PgdA/CDA1 family)